MRLYTSGSPNQAQLSASGYRFRPLGCQDHVLADELAGALVCRCPGGLDSSSLFLPPNLVVPRVGFVVVMFVDKDFTGYLFGESIAGAAIPVQVQARVTLRDF